MGMQNYIHQVTEFLQANFTPSDPDRANFKHTTQSLLQFLFLAFPSGCITDYELNDILLELGYTRQTWVEEKESETEEGKGKKGKKVIHKIHKVLITGWCLKTEFSLQTESFVYTENGKEKM